MSEQYKVKIKVYGSDAILDRVQELVSSSAYKLKREGSKLKCKVKGSVAEVTALANQVAELANEVKIGEVEKA